MLNINFANDWIRTADLWYRKRPLYNCATLLPIFLDFLQKGFTTLTSIPSFFREKNEPEEEVRI